MGFNNPSPRVIRCLYEIMNLQKQITRLDNDYQKLQTCKFKLAACSTLLKEILTQCEEIADVFDRRKIQAKYDNYNVTFHGIDNVFSSLDKISESTDIYTQTCNTLKSKIDSFGVTLDDTGISIANEAKDCHEKIRQLERERDDPIKNLFGD